jgi:adenine-specific DNA-methyltransferase
VIKYIGSKRRLAPVIGELYSRSGAATALDLFTGTTRVAQELKRRGAHVVAVDTARYSEVFAACHVATDAAEVDRSALDDELRRLSQLPGRAGYVTETFCRASRFFQPHNGERIDAIREAIEADHPDGPLRPLLLTSLIYAADRVDSTTGLQMAYVKSWAPRSYQPLELRPPRLLEGPGRAVRGDACGLVSTLPEVGFAYLDPPYNQHRYYTNYHVWETIVAWDSPDHYGVACKRADCRDPSTKSVFNARREMPTALARLVAEVRAEVLVLSYNDESWISLDDLVEICSARGSVAVLAYESKRYVGAQIGIYNPKGEKVGRVSHLRNLEYLLVAGPTSLVARLTEGVAAGTAQ